MIDISVTSGYVNHSKQDIESIIPCSLATKDKGCQIVDIIEWFSKRKGTPFQNGKARGQSGHDSISTSGVGVAVLPNCALVNRIMLFGMISELISRITKSLSLFYSVYMWKFTVTFMLDSRWETRSFASDPWFRAEFAFNWARLWTT